MKIFDKVKLMLEESPRLRDSDKKLYWELCNWGDTVHYMDWLEAPSYESVRRSRQKCQELFPELRGSEWVTARRREKEETKGTFIYREPVQENLI